MSLDDSQILDIVSQELTSASGGETGGDAIDSNRQAALASYLGQADGKEQAGRSSVVSTDVADAIEWILPEIVKAFTQNNDVVKFDATHEGDEQQAELESQYVYDIFMKDNNGFLVLHQFIKDALMQKNGFVKVFYENETTVTKESYTGLTPIEYDVLLGHKDVELVETTTTIHQEGEMEIPFYDCKVRISRTKGKVNVISVPPEEFRCSSMHNSVDLSTARFTAHVYLKTKSELVADGYDKELVDSFPTNEDYNQMRDYRFSMQEETANASYDASLDDSQQLIEIAECYMYMDIDEDGIAELVKVDVVGGENPTHILEIEEIEENPFISATAILMSHKLYGLSIYDRLKQIQEQKTTLWRNILDNMYFQNNQRTIVLENQVNLDDLMISRPGGIVRAKRSDAVMPFPTPQLPNDSYKMMDYLDQVRSGRVGVSPEGPVTDTMIGDRVGSQGVERMMSQKEELVGLMVRVIAETGVKPICHMIRRNVIKHQDVVADYVHRGNWIKVDPSTWRDRQRTTIRVGTGSGNRKEQLAALNTMFMLQEKIKAMPGQSLVDESRMFNAINDFAKFSGYAGAGQYFFDPMSPEGKQNQKKVAGQMQQNQKQMQQQQQMEAAVAQAQVKIAEAEQAKVKVQQENNQLEAQLNAVKQAADTDIKMLKQNLDEANVLLQNDQKSDDLQFKYWDAEERHKIEHKRIESQTAKANANGRKQESST
jgi:hypothetical protein